MRIATYNVNGINSRLPVLIKWLEESKPDVVCLQELKAPQDKFPIIPIQATGYNAIWHGQKSWNGVAVLTKSSNAREIRRILPGDQEDVNSRYIEVMVDDIIVGCLYLPNGNPVDSPKFEYKLRWFDRLRQHARELIATGDPVVLTGDFNVMPAEIDVYKPERWVNDALFRPEIRVAFKNITDQGWTDAIRKLYPGQVIYTFWDYFRNSYERNAGLRIDHFLLSPVLNTRLLAGGVDSHVRGWKKTSDHAPVWIELMAK
jgi:exodeoxyribonuclease III